MQLAQMKTPSPMWALAWKDFGQVRPALLAISLGLLGLQLIGLLIGALREQGPSLEGALIAAFVAPVLGGLACCGMLIGQERQTGTWAWSSSLPVTWQQVLLSKLLVTLFGSIAIVGPLLCVPAAMWFSGTRLPANNSVEVIYATPVMVLVFLETIVFLTITTLLFRETLTGMIVGAVGILLTQGIFSWLAASNLTRSVGWASMSVSGLTVLQMAVWLAFGVVILAFTFRWRWGLGQQTDLFTRPAADMGSVPPSRAVRNAPSPRPFLKLLQLSCRMSIVTRLAITVGFVCCLPYTFAFGLHDGAGFATFLALIASGLFGMTAFEGDQSLQRYRFLADRGVRPEYLVTARLAPPFLLSALALGVVLVSHAHAFRGEFPWLFGCLLYVLNTAFFTIGAFSSLCFSRPVIAFAVGLLSLFGIWGIYLSLQLGGPYFDLSWLFQWSLALAPLSVLLLVLAIYSLARRWIIADRPKLEWRYAWIMSIVGLLPLGIAVSCGFLAIPNVPWRGVTLPAGVQEKTWHLPGLPEDDLLPGETLTLGFYSRWPLEQQGSQYLQTAAGLDKQWLTAAEAALDELQAALESPKMQNIQDPLPWISRFEALACHTAVVAIRYQDSGDVALARQAWRCNRLLLEIDMDS